MTFKYPDAELWYGETLFNLKRWAFWKERLRWIAEQGELLENTRSTALSIVARMDDIERDPQKDKWERWVYQ